MTKRRAGMRLLATVAMVAAASLVVHGCERFVDLTPDPGPFPDAVLFDAFGMVPDAFAIDAGDVFPDGLDAVSDAIVRDAVDPDAGVRDAVLPQEGGLGDAAASVDGGVGDAAVSADATVLPDAAPDGAPIPDGGLVSP